MTPKEIVQSLKGCFGFGGCSGCAAREAVAHDPLPCKMSCKETLGLCAADLIEQQEAKIKELEEKAPEWVPVEERLPENEERVMIRCIRNGYITVLAAIYEDGSVTTEDSRWNWNEYEEYLGYSEENDVFVIPRGWWGKRYFTPDDADSVYLCCAVTHWMPVPKPPKDSY